MKRVAVLLGLAVAAPSVAQAQLPVAPAAEAPSPPPPAPSGPEATEPARPPGDQYFVDQAPPPPPVAEEPPPFEPPPPLAAAGFEPPPPPQARHVAPERSLWLGARVGWFFPFGNVWSRVRPASAGSGDVLEGVPWRDYASSGPMLEVDVGMRLSRAYTVFALWERAQLGSGDDTSVGKPDGAESDFWAAGLRASSNPDGLGFLTEVAVGYRRARSFYDNDFEVQFTDAPFEARLGLGGELRLNRMTSLSGLVTIGVGGFGEVQTVAPNGTALPRTRPEDQGDGHAWATLHIGGHFDLLPSAH